MRLSPDKVNRNSILCEQDVPLLIWINKSAMEGTGHKNKYPVVLLHGPLLPSIDYLL